MLVDKENSLKKAYANVLEVGFGKGTLDEISDFIDANVMGYGTAKDEKILSIDGFKALIEQQRQQAVNFEEFRFTSNPVVTRFLNHGETAVVADEIKVLTKINGNTNSLFLRMTVVFEWQNGVWRVVHWHGSIPEHASDGEDPFHVTEWQKKQFELEKQLAEKTVDLLKKNQELEIEAALERVRTVAMSMSSSDDLLSICEVTFKELQHLGFNHLRNAVIHIPNDEEQYFMDYDYSSFTGGQIGKVEYGLHPIVDEYLKKIRSAEDAFFEIVIEEEMLDEWNEFRRQSGQMDDKRLEKADALYYYLFSIGIGDIGISTFRAINEAQINVLKRFRNVFNLAYRRYTDIALAEAQAKDAQIEAALERVRSKAMGMRKSEEVGAVSDMLFLELNKLDFDISGCSVVVIDKPEDKMELWRARSNVAVKPFETTSLSKMMHILEKHMPYFFPKFLNALDARKGLEIEEFSGKRRLQLIQAITEQYHYSDVEKSVLEKNTPDTITTHFLFFKLGYLVLLSEKKLSEEDLSIAGRFLDVFSFAYSRFLDIKRAEAQAREAQIEAALERVRSKAMSMHNSENLLDTISEFFAQLKFLNIIPVRCGVSQMFNDPPSWKAAATISTIQGESVQLSGKVDNLNHEVLKNIYEFWVKQENYFPVLEGEDIKEYYKALRPQVDIPKFPKGENHYGHYFNFKEGNIFAWTKEPLSEDEKSIFIRFSSVLSLTYRRYLDLKESEQKAREAQIEAALERIRTQSMAMQHSDDLIKSTSILFNELEKLKLPLLRCGIGIFDKKTRDCELYTTVVNDKGEAELVRGVTSLTMHPMLIKTFECWESQKSLQYVLEGKELTDYYKLVSKSNFHLPEDVLNKSASLAKEYYLYTPFGAGGLYVFSDAAPSVELLKIFRRFAQVFQMTYTRYEDLQRAEEQAREANIEAALERVRAKTMAMHNSEDLTSAVRAVFSELDNLGFKTVRCGIGIFNDISRKVNFWTASPGRETRTALLAGDEILEGHPLLEKIYDGWQNQRGFSYTLTGKELNDYYKYTKTSNLPVKGPEQISHDTTQYYHCVMFPAGGLFAFRNEPFSEEALMLMKRFADVFNLAFIRHLDLKQAEEHNRIILAENERKSLELEEARQLQLSMLPKELPQLSHLDIAVHMHTATEVGGDYYDFSFKEDGSLNIALGDATGHGMKAGIMVSSMKSIFTTNSTKMDLPSFFATANSGIKSMGLKRMMMGFAMVNINQNKFRLINAGMPPVFLYRQKSRLVEELTEHCMPIGAISFTQFTVNEQVLEKGDTILLLSDGLPELQNGNNEMFGYERIRHGFQSVAEKAPEEIVEHFKSTASHWGNGKAPDDDVTFLVIKVK